MVLGYGGDCMRYDMCCGLCYGIGCIGCMGYGNDCMGYDSGLYDLI